MFAILALIMLVAALNIISGLIMLVQDKARAIAVLRTAIFGTVHLLARLRIAVRRTAMARALSCTSMMRPG